MERFEPLQVVFYMTATGHEPVREWLRSLYKNDKKQIGEDIKTVQFGWPIGMPVVEKLDRDLWEVRTKLRNKISRVLFTVHEDQIVLLHGFIKKSQKVHAEDLELAQRRKNEIKRG
jgi:phage-related protein